MAAIAVRVGEEMRGDLRWFATALVMVATWSLAPTRAGAEEADVRLLRPVAGTDSLVGIRGARVKGHRRLQLQVVAGWVDDVLVTAQDEHPLARPLDGRWLLDLGAALALGDRLEVAVGLPIFPWQTGGPTGSVTQDQHALGDVLLGVKVSLLPPGARAGLAASVVGTLPTATDGDWVGESKPTLTPALLADVELLAGARAMLNVGYHLRPRSEVQGLVFDDELRVGLALLAPLGLGSLAALLEAEAALGLGGPAEDGDDERHIDERRSPAEVRAGLRWCGPRQLSWTVGGGYGVTKGYGAPDLRALLMVGWTPHGAGACPVEQPAPAPHGPEPGAPPPGSAEAPPTPSSPSPAALGPRPIPPETFDALVAADPDPDGDGIATAADACPLRPEDLDGHADADGCPDDDNDGDGVLDGADRCPTEQETINGVDDEDGCPDEGDARVLVGPDRLELTERIFFETASDALQRRSTGILKQAAQVLRAGLGDRRVRVEGHTDSQGDPERNVDLSERRARRVMAFLVNAGVPAAALEARGYGPARPLESNDTAAGRGRNRRVEFRILSAAAGEQP